jgi:hypothetical protein
MTATLSKEELAALDAVVAKATPGEWEVDSERSEGEYGTCPDTSAGYDDYCIGVSVNGKWETLATTENATIKEIDEDYDEDSSRAWDRIGDANTTAIVSLHNAYPALRATIDAERARADKLTEALRACRRATLHGADEPRHNVREIVDEAFRSNDHG